MNFDDMSKLIAEKTGQSVCVVCGMPFKPRKKGQKTCGNEDCQREWRKKYQQERQRKLREEDPERWKAYHREAQKKSRNKHRNIDYVDAKYRSIEERYRIIEEKNKNITGVDYGKRQAERTLASVPKIDVNLEGGRRYDDVHSKDDE